MELLAAIWDFLTTGPGAHCQLSIWPLLIAAGIGAVKAATVDKVKEESDRRLAAETARYSPWTNLNPQNVKIRQADPFGSALQYGATGLALDQGGAFGGAKTAGTSAWGMPTAGQSPNKLGLGVDMDFSKFTNAKYGV